jgi:hypothetical protein
MRPDTPAERRPQKVDDDAAPWRLNHPSHHDETVTNRWPRCRPVDSCPIQVHRMKSGACIDLFRSTVFFDLHKRLCSLMYLMALYLKVEQDLLNLDYLAKYVP